MLWTNFKLLWPSCHSEKGGWRETTVEAFQCWRKCFCWQESRVTKPCQFLCRQKPADTWNHCQTLLKVTSAQTILKSKLGCVNISLATQADLAKYRPCQKSYLVIEQTGLHAYAVSCTRLGLLLCYPGQGDVFFPYHG